MKRSKFNLNLHLVGTPLSIPKKPLPFAFVLYPSEGPFALL